jgi:N-acetyltransferase
VIWPPPRRDLEGSIVRLEPLRADHAQALLRASRDERIWEWMDREAGRSEDAFRRWFEARLEGSEAGAEWGFATVSAEGGEALGSSSYLAPRPQHDGVEIGWTWLKPAVWRTGANREQKLLMLGFAFDELGAMRVEFKTDARNERSRAALAALPATFEGVFRKHMVMSGIGVRDSAYFSITDEDWPAVKDRLKAGGVGKLAGRAG